MTRTLLCSVLVLLAGLALAGPAQAGVAATDDYLDAVADDPIDRGEFFRALPKGGDLHHHLSGAVYAESMVGWAAQDGLCLDSSSYRLSSPPCGAGTVPAANMLSDIALYNKAIAAWSMRGFVPGPLQSGHDHFFATFDLFGAALSAHQGEALAEVAQRAASQNAHVLETLITPQFSATRALGLRIGLDQADLEGTRARLLAGGMAEVVAAARAQTDGIEAQYRAALGCGGPNASPTCELPVRFQVQVVRTQPPEVVFAALVAGFELMESDPRWVAVNLVAPEDEVVATRDYRLHMRMIGDLRPRYERDNVTLHAGELAPGLVAPADLRFHINDAVTTAGAERIGHGVSITSERGARSLLRRMAARDIAVEILLVSNAQILEVEGPAHPLPLYRRYGVPVTLATDDEGVSRSDLSAQYELAWEDFGLDYVDLKEISLAGLEKSFLQPADKAVAQRRLDADFRAFERRFRR